MSSVPKTILIHSTVPIELQHNTRHRQTDIHRAIPHTALCICVAYLSRGKAEIPREQFPRSIFADTPDMSDILARMVRGCRACRATSPFSLPRAYLIGRPAVCCGVVLPVCRVSCRSPNSTSMTLTTCCGQVASILVASSSDTSDTPDFLVTC